MNAQQDRMTAIDEDLAKLSGYTNLSRAPQTPKPTG